MDDKYISLVAKYLSGEISDHEREILFGLINSSAEHKVYFEEIQTLWELSGEMEDDPIDVFPDKAWQKVSARINAPEEETKKRGGTIRRFYFGPLLRIAAMLIGIIGAIWLWNEWSGETAQTLVFQTEDNEKRQLQLPDGSTVWLNENSSLSYLSDFKPRTLELTGEAFFEVQHLQSDAPFVIRSGETLTKVLGTSFNVRAYPGESQVEVTVETGKVAFEREATKIQSEKVLLSAGEAGVYKKKEQNVSKQNAATFNANAWKKEELIFEDTPLSDVIKDLERYFEIDIELENSDILNCPLTGAYPNPKIDELVRVLEFSLDLKVNQNEQKLLLSGAGCD